MNNRKHTFGKFLRETRLKRHLSQEKLSELSYINVKTISNMENSKINFDLEKLDILSPILGVDLIEKYFEIIYDDCNNIEDILSSLNKKDRYNGVRQSHEISELEKIRETTRRKVVKLKVDKLILFFKSIEINDNTSLRKDLIIKALNIGGNFDFINLNNNYYDDIDYRILMNYALCLDSYDEKLRIYKFIENSECVDTNIRAILYHNISNLFYILENNKLALDYIDKAIALNSNNPKSDIMLYTKAIILMELDLPYESYIKEALNISKNSDIDSYNFIIQKYNNINK